MLGSLFLEKTADAVVAALDAGDAGGPVAVIDLVRLGRLLAGRGRAVVQVAARPRSLRRAEGARVHAAATALPIAEGSLGALVVSGVGDVDDWEQRMAGWIQAVRDGGLLVFVDRGPAAELSRRALCGGRRPRRCWAPCSSRRPPTPWWRPSTPATPAARLR